MPGNVHITAPCPPPHASRDVEIIGRERHGARYEITIKHWDGLGSQMAELCFVLQPEERHALARALASGKPPAGR